jgi:hypothetical protein
MTGASGTAVDVTGELYFTDVTVDERDELEVQITVHGTGAENDAFRRWLRKDGAEPVVKQVQQFLDDLDQQARSGQVSFQYACFDHSRLTQAR